MAQLFGHLRVPQEKKVEAGGNDDGVAAYIPDMKSAILLGPSVTPLHGNDPSFIILRYDRRGDERVYRLVYYDSHSYFMTANKVKTYRSF
jgi:hypothetical protein